MYSGHLKGFTVFSVLGNFLLPCHDVGDADRHLDLHGETEAGRLNDGGSSSFLPHFRVLCNNTSVTLAAGPQCLDYYVWQTELSQESTSTTKRSLSMEQGKNCT